VSCPTRACSGRRCAPPLNRTGVGLPLGIALLFSAGSSASKIYAAIGMIGSAAMFLVIVVRGRLVKRDG
jgi:hypothetical protein